MEQSLHCARGAKQRRLGEGKVSLAYRLTYRAPDRTLKDDEVNRAHEEIKNVLRNKLKVEIRDS